MRAYSRDVIADNALTTEAESSPDRLKVLRMERLAPAVLLVLFDGVPEVVHIEEPRQGIQFGIRYDEGAEPSQRSARVKVRDCNTGDPVAPVNAITNANSVPVPFRAGAPGVIDLATLRTRLAAKAPNSGGTLESNEFALQMLRFPYRQVFGDPDNQDEAGDRQFYDLGAVQGDHRPERVEEHNPAGHRAGESMTDRIALDPEAIRQIVQGKRFLAADRAKTRPARDRHLGRVPAARAAAARAHRRAGAVRAVRRNRGDGPAADARGRSGWRRCRPAIEDGMPEPFADGTPRPAGVHLHWAMPDALLRGTLDDVAAGAPTGWRCRCCPIAGSCCACSCRPAASDPVVTGWVLEADRAVAVPLGTWTEGGAASRDATPMGTRRCRPTSSPAPWAAR